MSAETPPVAPLATRRRALTLALAAGLTPAAAPTAAWAASRAEIEREGKFALDQLYANSSRARELAGKSRAILVFPKIVKAGFAVGGLTGNGVFLQGGKAVGYYNLSAGSFGLQAGVQKYSYALFFITQKSVDYLRKSGGWAIGSGPSVVIVDAGKAKTINTTTLTQDVYAFPFGQKGLMAGIGLEGSKITSINPS